MFSIYAIVSQLIKWDTSLLLFLNGHSTDFMDSLIFLISDKYIWLPLYLTLALAVYIRVRWVHAIIFFVVLALLITATDQTCGSLLRPMMERMRPSNLANPISPFIHIVNDYRGGRYGFPSCHAANMFALAVFLSGIFRRRWVTITLFSWAILVAFSRVYLGVHYPGDILLGSIIGITYALIFLRLGYFIIYTLREKKLFSKVSHMKNH